MIQEAKEMAEQKGMDTQERKHKENEAKKKAAKDEVAGEAEERTKEEGRRTE